MKLNGRQTAGVACIVGGAAAYLWLMSTEVVPTALELAANLGVPVPIPVTWIGLTVAALAVVFGAGQGVFAQALVESAVGHIAGSRSAESDALA